MDRIKAGAFRVPRNVSPAAADLIRRLLVQDQHARLSPSAVLAHPWVVKHCGASPAASSAAGVGPGSSRAA
jgi:aurora kinase